MTFDEIDDARLRELMEWPSFIHEHGEIYELVQRLKGSRDDWKRTASNLSRALNSTKAEHYLHVKTNRVYTIVSRAAALEAIPSETYVVYRGPDGQDWIRPQHEFFDGRFELTN